MRVFGRLLHLRELPREIIVAITQEHTSLQRNHDETTALLREHDKILLAVRQVERVVVKKKEPQ